MTEPTYFTRWKGTVMGPFSLARLQALVAQGQITPYHEISQDRQDWILAKQIPELFPIQPEMVVEEKSAPVEETKERESASDPKVWYYMLGEEKMGPVSMNTLRNLVRRRSLQKDDVVWKEGKENSQLADTIPELVSVFRSVKQSLGNDSIGGESHRGKAIAGFVLSLVGLVTFFGALILGILGVIFSRMALKGMAQSGNQEGKGLATAGLVLGIIDIVIGGLILLFWVLFGLLITLAGRS